MRSLIAVKHNIEVAHRLWETPGKCQQIHGHSMWVTMYLTGEPGPTGIIQGPDGDLEFGEIKSVFRHYLDSQFDHHLILNASDPFSRPFFQVEPMGLSEVREDGKLWRQTNGTELQTFLPGLQSVPGDPTTENIARWIGERMYSHEGLPVQSIEVWETSVNMARWER